MPDHQFGFRQKHAATEQVHRITNVKIKALDSIKYCTAAFLDISQAFDKVWHEELLYKLKTLFPDSIYKILNSYLENTEQFIRPSGISDLCGTVAGMVTPKGSMSTEGETLQVLERFSTY